MKKRTSETTSSQPDKRQKTTKETDFSDETFDKYSQNVDIETALRLHKDNTGRVYNSENKQVLMMIFGKNFKIGKKLDVILEYLKKHGAGDEGDSDKEIIMIGVGKSVQKMITVIEILKQKIEPLGDIDEEGDGDGSRVKNNMIAKIKDSDKVRIKGVEADEKLKFNCHQFNHLDFTTVEKEQESGDTVTTNGEIYDKNVIEDILKNKVVDIPVMYSYIKLEKTKTSSICAINRFKDLMKNGWSKQNR